MCAFTSCFVWTKFVERGFSVCVFFSSAVFHFFLFIFFFLFRILVAQRLAHWIENRSTNARRKLPCARATRPSSSSSAQQQKLLNPICVCVHWFAFFFILRCFRLLTSFGVWVNIKLTPKWLHFGFHMQQRRLRRLTFVHSLSCLCCWLCFIKDEKNLFAIQRRRSIVY